MAIKIGRAKEFVKNVIESGVRVPILLNGESGIGKSQIVSQAAKELGMSIIDLRLSQMEPGDLIGIPRGEDGKTVWLKPSWFPTDENSKGILFLDEINRAPLDMRQAVFQLLTEYRIHTNVLPSNWFVVCAVNPDNGEYQVESMDPAMISRMVNITVEPDVTSWLSWAKEANVAEEVIGFINAHNALLHKIVTGKPSPCPRTWKMTSDLVKKEIISTSSELNFEVLSATVGSEAAQAYIKYMHSKEKAFSGKDIIENYKKCRAKIIEKKENGERAYTNDKIAETLRSLMAEIPKDGTDLANKLGKTGTDNIIKFVLDIPRDFAFSFIKEMVEKCPSSMGIVTKSEEVHSLLMSAHNSITGEGKKNKEKESKESKE